MNKLIKISLYTAIAFLLTALVGGGISFSGALPGALLGGAFAALIYGIVTTALGGLVVAALGSLLNWESAGRLIESVIFVGATVLSFKLLAPYVAGLAVANALLAGVVALAFSYGLALATGATKLDSKGFLPKSGQ